jgi:hypothetical protein
MAHHKRGSQQCAGGLQDVQTLEGERYADGARGRRAVERSSPPGGRNAGGGAQGCVTGWPSRRATRTPETGTYPRPTRSHRGAGW